jgi:hypothetical protein
VPDNALLVGCEVNRQPADTVPMGYFNIPVQVNGERWVAFFMKFANALLGLSGFDGHKSRAVDTLFPFDIQFVQLLKIVFAIPAPHRPETDHLGLMKRRIEPKRLSFQGFQFKTGRPVSRFEPLPGKTGTEQQDRHQQQTESCKPLLMKHSVHWVHPYVLMLFRQFAQVFSASVDTTNGNAAFDQVANCFQTGRNLD